VRLVRFRQGDRIATGLYQGEYVLPLRGTFFEDPVPTGEEIPLDAVRLLAPVIPSKIVAVGRNYAEHAEELGNPMPEEPIIFLKPSTSVIGPEDDIPYPEQSARVDHEGELALVVGRFARRVPAEEVSKYVLGYTCANDVTARDLQDRDPTWGPGSRPSSTRWTWPSSAG
jgi:2-keto-4-pentenoate hydratase/2-oxohepta-3-ene-1,7-dioic acid hydratase in catechol pathway